MNELAKNGQQRAIVVLADIESSGQPAERELARTGLQQLLERVNDERQYALVVPFSISHGDEIQGLLEDPAELYPVIGNLDLDSELFSFRFGVGWGEVATGFAPRSWEMDGACFHAARRALERGRREKRWVTVQGFGEAGDRTANAVFRLMHSVRKRWTNRQRIAVRTYKLSDTQTAAAKEMGLDKSTLSKMLKAARYRDLLEMEGALGDLLGFCTAAAGKEQA